MLIKMFTYFFTVLHNFVSYFIRKLNFCSTSFEKKKTLMRALLFVKYFIQHYDMFSYLTFVDEPYSEKQANLHLHMSWTGRAQ